MLGQFVVRPLPFHRHAPSVGTEWTRGVLRTAREWALTSGLGLVTKVPRMTSVGTLKPIPTGPRHMPILTGWVRLPDVPQPEAKSALCRECRRWSNALEQKADKQETEDWSRQQVQSSGRTLAGTLW
jgi:hypothetical protein